MKKILFLLLLGANLSLLSAQDLKLMTYNMRLDLAVDGENAWSLRKAFFVKQLTNHGPDVFGTQEGLPHQIDFIDKELNDYSYIGIGRDGGKGKGEYCAIFYKKEKFKLLQSNTFWLSKTSEISSIGWDAAYIRICTYGLFKDKKTGLLFWIFNTHLDNRGEQARKKGLRLIYKKIKKVNRKKYPVILMGDLNAEPDKKIIKGLSRKYIDAKSVDKKTSAKTEGTFNAFKISEAATRRIDYIFLDKKNFKIKNYQVSRDSEKEKYPSDHFPVIAEVAFLKTKEKTTKILSADSNYQLVWSDEFNTGKMPDTSKWNYRVGDGCPELCGFGNGERQWYSDARPKNCRIENGKLLIEAHKEDIGTRHYSSARLNSRYKGDWLYGRMEIKAKLPRGLGIWPAVWMLPTDWEYGGWPDSGEIDIMEHVGFEPDSIKGTVHTKAFNHLKGTHKGMDYRLDDCEDTFHLYGIEWTEDKIDFFVDHTIYFTFKNTGKGWEEYPYDKRFYFILNIAVGGNLGGRKGVDDSIWPQKMEIDYVRVYQNAKK